MFVLQNKTSNLYVRRLFKEENGGSVDTYKHEPYLNQATIFAGWWDVAKWMNNRAIFGFTPANVDWVMVEVKAIPQPIVKVVRVIG